MQIWPAIDLRGGKCVRLQQGDYHRETVFGEDPAAMAQHFESQGGEYLHLVDLDGARSAASLTKQLTEFAREWVDVRILLPRGRMLVLHPAAENGLSVGRYDREYFANLLDYVVGPTSASRYKNSLFSPYPV